MANDENRQGSSARAHEREWNARSAHTGRRKTSPRKREKSLPPMGPIETNVLRCQAARTRMHIAQHQSKLSEYLDALELVEEEPDDEVSRAEALAAELADLQSRRDEMLRDMSSDYDSSSESSDDDDELVEAVVEQPEEAVVVTPERREDATDFCAVALPYKQRPAWEISVAEPIVFDALMRHQERVWEKRREPVYDYRAAPKLAPPPAPAAKQTPVEGQLFVFNAVQKGLADIAPYLFDYYSTRSSTEAAAKRPDPYATAYVDHNARIDIWDPHPNESTDFDELGFLEAQLNACDPGDI